MPVTNFGQQRPQVPISGTALNVLDVRDYSQGLYTYAANDVTPNGHAKTLTDNRFSTLGRLQTRKGADFYSDAAGETADDTETSVTGAADQTVSIATRHAAKFTTTTAGRLTKVEINVKNADAATGVLRVDIYNDDSGEPGTLLGESSIQASEITSSYAYEVARFINAPQLATTTDYWIVAYIQAEGTNEYKWSSTTNATTALKSTDSGVTWSSTSYDLNFRTYLSTDSGVLGLHRAYKSDGTKKTLMAHGTDLYTVDDVTGALTSIKSSLNASATDYHFVSVNDVVYYVNGFDGLRKWDYTTESSVSVSPFTDTPSNIALHKNKLFLVSADDPSKLFFSDLADYESFTSTSFIYVPDPKSPEPITGMEVLNGVLYLFTEENKWALYGDDKKNFNLVKAPGKKGTYSQDSVVADRNFVYFMAEDGVYRFNGTTDELISEKITDRLSDIADLSRVKLGFAKNRLHIYYPFTGSANNNRSFVYNTHYEAWESEDLNTPICCTSKWNSSQDNNQYIVGSAVAGQLFYSEEETNEYNNLGAPLTWELRTRYEHFGNPAAKKRVKRLNPRFEKQSGNQSVEWGYDFDFLNSPTFNTISLQSSAATFGSGIEFGDGTTFGGDALSATRETIPSSARYIQLRYRLKGSNVPVEFMGHTLMYRTKRIK